MTDSPNQNTSPEKLSTEDSPAQVKTVFNMESIRKRQRVLLWGIGSCLMGGIIVYGWVAMGETSSSPKQEFKNSLTTGSSRINPQEAWFYQFRNDAELAKKRLDAMEAVLTNILKIHETSKTSNPSAKGNQNSSSYTLTQQTKKSCGTYWEYP